MDVKTSRYWRMGAVLAPMPWRAFTLMTDPGILSLNNDVKTESP